MPNGASRRPTTPARQMAQASTGSSRRQPEPRASGKIPTKFSGSESCSVNRSAKLFGTDLGTALTTYVFTRADPLGWQRRRCSGSV
eukprot:CAMPEP_0194751218 /NCGR_PEP_ID=MMETSP0323_2-20130528/5320_1 /TAXON_ID=2866 ORGANISM="Crypthecodinium cohnii, Strain Seligo" /NCGR_SAMPLE_ID=MMETSP0323_2 /ASSEMBLY_ACC=CAM_ASM_000346 /LENGTH=85 /DNA_ID=CAMNT_0039667605 /DNA_START=14 /DNA_END=268 /DNA_ORIENTATION=+